MIFFLGDDGEPEMEEDGNSASVKVQSLDLAVPPSYKVETGTEI